MRARVYLILTGFIQVMLVSVNTFFLAKGFLMGVLLAAFLISLVWSFNVKKVAFGSWPDRVLYSIGAALGSGSGLFIGSYILTFV